MVNGLNPGVLVVCHLTLKTLDSGGLVSLSCVCSFLEHVNVAYQRVFIQTAFVKLRHVIFLCDQVHMLANSLHSLLAFFPFIMNIL